MQSADHLPAGLREAYDQDPVRAAFTVDDVLVGGRRRRRRRVRVAASGGATASIAVLALAVALGPGASDRDLLPTPTSSISGAAVSVGGCASSRESCIAAFSDWAEGFGMTAREPTRSSPRGGDLLEITAAVGPRDFPGALLATLVVGPQVGRVSSPGEVPVEIAGRPGWRWVSKEDLDGEQQFVVRLPVEGQELGLYLVLAVPSGLPMPDAAGDESVSELAARLLGPA